MSSQTIYLTGNSLSANYTTFYGPILIKGTASILFNLYDIQEELNPVIGIIGYFGDGAEYSDTINLNTDLSNLNAIEIAETGKIRCIAQEFEHTYNKDQSTVVDYLTASFFLTYASQRRGAHYVILQHVKDSFYDNIQELHINATQMMPVSTNDVIAIASNYNGDVFHLQLSRTAINSLSSTDTTTLSSYILAPRTIRSCFTLVAQQGGSIIPVLSA